MAWYRTGTVAVTNGSAVVTGTGTLWTANARAADGFRGPDGKFYEILTVGGNTSITLAENYTGTTLSGQAYAIVPTQGLTQTLAAAVQQLVADYAGVLAGAGAGRFADGTLAAPGISFASDPDCGIRRFSANVLDFIIGGANKMTLNADGLTAPALFTTAGNLANGTFRAWSASDTDIDSLVAGSTVGLLLEGASIGHFTVGLRSNDNGDSFSVISKQAGDPTYTLNCFNVTAAGVVSFPGSAVIGGTAAVSGNLDLSAGVDHRIRLMTTAGADTNRLIITAADSISTARGAYILLNGINHPTTPGDIDIVTASGGSVTMNGSAGLFLGGGTGGVLSTSNLSGLGYGTGAGGTVTQATSKATNVTINRPCGQITTNGAALAGGAFVAFTVNNSTVAAGDSVTVNVSTSAYIAVAYNVGAGFFSILLQNRTGGSLSEQPVITFNVHKGATS